MSYKQEKLKQEIKNLKWDIAKDVIDIMFLLFGTLFFCMSFYAVIHYDLSYGILFGIYGLGNYIFAKL